MHLKNERFFIIGGYITNNIHRIKSIHKKCEYDIKVRKHIPIKEKVELKSSRINNKQQIYFLNRLLLCNDVILVSIIIDKYNLSKFEASENVAYNFFVKSLLNYLFKCNSKLLTTDIEIRLDNRSIAVKNLKDLETFLSWEFNKDNIYVKYLDSKDNRDIQMADYVANYEWKKYNLKKFLRINYHHMLVSKFPIKEFNKSLEKENKEVL